MNDALSEKASFRDAAAECLMFFLYCSSLSFAALGSPEKKEEDLGTNDSSARVFIKIIDLKARDSCRDSRAKPSSARLFLSEPYRHRGNEKGREEKKIRLRV